MKSIKSTYIENKLEYVIIDKKTKEIISKSDKIESLLNELCLSHEELINEDNNKKNMYSKSQNQWFNFTTGENENTTFILVRKFSNSMIPYKVLEALLTDNDFDLESLETIYQQVLRSIPDILCYLDKNLNVLGMNKAGEEHFELKSTVGKKCYDVFEYNEECKVCPSKQALLSKEPVIVEKFNNRLEKWLEVTRIPIFDDNDELIMIVEQLKDIDKRKNMELELRENEAKFRSYVENTQDIIFTLNEKGVFQYVSPSWQDPLKYALDEVEGKVFLDFIHPDDREVSVIYLNEIMAGKKDPHPVEYRVLHKHDGWKWHRASGSLIIDANGEKLMLGITRDINESKENERRLAQLSKEFQIVFQGSQYSMYLVEVIDRDTYRYLQANKAQEVITGLSESRLVGHTPQEALGEEIGADILKHYKACYDKKEPYIYEVKRVFKSGTKEILTTLTPVLEESEVKYIVGATRDITDQRKAERELKRNLEQSRLLVEIFEHDAKTESELLDFGLRQAIRLTSSEIGYIFFYDEQSKNLVLNAWSEEAMQQCTVKDPEVIYHLDSTGLWGEPVRRREAIIVNDFDDFKELQKGAPKGHVKLHKFAAIPVIRDNSVVATVGVGNKRMDYTEADINQLSLLTSKLWESLEKKRAEKQVENERKKLEITLASIGDGVISTDNDGKIVYLNKVAEKLTGYKFEEVENQYFDEYIRIIDEDSRERTKSPIQSVLETKKIIELDDNSTLVTKDGNEIPIADSAAPIMDEDELVGVVLVFRDVTKDRESLNRIQFLSYNDQLTGVRNRRYFEQELQRISDEKHLPLSLLMADLNGLKLVNDGFGHQKGDELLMKTAQVLLNNAPEKATVARIGGDEFIIILPNTDYKDALILKEKLEYEADKIDLTPITLSISFGLATRTHLLEEIDDLLREAEDNMYHDKLHKSPSIRGKTLSAIMSALYEKSEREEKHSTRVSQLCEKIAMAMDLDSKSINELKMAGILHDIGKITIDLTILEKDGPLSAEEWTMIKKHSEIGYRILSAANDMSEIANYVLAHHERIDGKGYPKGLSGDEIPYQSKVIAIADAYDAMTSNRPYRQAMSKEEAISELYRYSDIQFDKDIVEIFVKKVLNDD